MLHDKSTNLKIDRLIDSYQRELYDHIAKNWDVSQEIINGYGRCDRQEANGEYFPAFPALDTDKDYTPILHSDDFGVTFFFGTNDSVSHKAGARSTTCHLVVVVDFLKIGLGVSHMGDVEAMETVYEYAKRGRMGLILTEYGKGLDYCFRDYSALRKSNDWARFGMYPKMCMRFEYNVNY